MRQGAWIGRSFNRGWAESVLESEGTNLQGTDPGYRYDRRATVNAAAAALGGAVRGGAGADVWQDGDPLMGDVTGELSPGALKGCENPLLLSAFVASVKLDSIVKGFTAGMVSGLVAAVAIQIYLRKKG